MARGRSGWLGLFTTGSNKSNWFLSFRIHVSMYHKPWLIEEREKERAKESLELAMTAILKPDSKMSFDAIQSTNWYWWHCHVCLGLYSHFQMPQRSKVCVERVWNHWAQAMNAKRHNSTGFPLKFTLYCHIYVQCLFCIQHKINLSLLEWICVCENERMRVVERERERESSILMIGFTQEKTCRQLNVFAENLL